MQSTREIVFGIAVAAALALGACEKKPSAPPPQPQGTTGEAHEHAPGEGHDEGEHGHDHDAGEKHDLGTATVGAFEVQAARYGTLTPGKESDVDIRVGGTAGHPAAVRVWIGTEDARGSMKAKAEAEADHYHAHVEVPDPMPQDARLWVEIEAAGGERSTGSFPLAR